MIRITLISPENEGPVAERLSQLIASTWPDVAGSTQEHIDILVGIRTPTDLDILVVVNLQRARPFPAQRRRDGTVGVAGEVRHALIAIEVKQSDVRDARRLGNQLFVKQKGKDSNRSVTDQVLGAAHSLKTFFGKYVAAVPYIYALGWFTSLDEETLAPIDASNLGAAATWPAMLDACVQQQSGILFPMSPVLARGLSTLRTVLTNRKIETVRSAAKVTLLAAELSSQVVDKIVSDGGEKQVQLTGRGGSGKTTTLALVAIRLAEVGERVLILTFHRTLRTDIAQLIDSLAERCNVAPDAVHVDTTMNFLMSTLESLDVKAPLKDDGVTVDWESLDRTLDETRAMLVGDPEGPSGDAARLKAKYPARFAWDYILVDESQDWHDAERDFLRALFGHKRVVLADGRDQLVRRRVACNWIAGIASAERVSFSLDTSLRMLSNIACFGNAVASAIGFDVWQIAPNERLPGGRVLIVDDAAIDGAFLRAMIDAAAADKATAADCLVCLPARSKTFGDVRREECIAAAADAGIAIWDGTQPENRDDAVSGKDALRLVRYDSCRGLEGWATLVVDLDDLVQQKTTHPNAHPGDPETDAHQAALRWMLIPLTRAVQTLVITLRDPNSEVARILRAASTDERVPRNTVTWFGSLADAKSFLQGAK
jgi:hypothetical protein